MQQRSATAFPRTNAILASLLAVVASTPALGLMTSHEGNAPLSPANYTQWPGLAEVVNDKSRVFHVWVNGNEEAFYRGDTAALARTLRAFAATKVEERIVILRPSRGKFQKPRVGSTSYDWKLSFIGGIARGLLDEEDAELVWEKHPTLTIYTGGAVDLESLWIPKGITQLLGVHDLRERYVRGIRSPSQRVRSYSVQFLAEVDPYGAKSEALVAELSRGEKVQSAVDRALAEFKTRADDPADVQARHKAEILRIRQFLFAWRYPWLETALGLTLILAAVLLCATLVAAWAKRSRRPREPKGAVNGQPAGAT